MRLRPASRAVLAGASLLAASVGPGPASRADILIGTSVIPTSTVVTGTSYVPTSYVTSSYIPTSYLTSSYYPTSAILPTSAIYPTSTILETGSAAYYPTSYVTSYRRGLFRPRRFVERTSYYATPLTPTSYYAPTAYLTPTTYVTPTSYVTSSYLAPTSYLVPTMASSAVLPTTYVAGSYVTPTSVIYDSGVITTSATLASACCDSSPAAPAPPVQTRAVAPSGPMGPPVAQAPGAVVSSPKSTAPPTTYDNPPTASTIPDPAAEPATTPGVAKGATDAAAPTVPTQQPVGGLDPGAAGATPPAPQPASDSTMPLPGEISKPKLDETSARRRSALRPAFSASRNVLRGRVVARSTLNPEEGVDVVLTDPTRSYGDVVVRSDADGLFSVSLPTGDWDVNVTTPEGRLQPVARSMTAAKGKVFDAKMTAVGQLLIKL